MYVWYVYTRINAYYIYIYIYIYTHTHTHIKYSKMNTHISLLLCPQLSNLSSNNVIFMHIHTYIHMYIHTYTKHSKTNTHMSLLMCPQLSNLSSIGMCDVAVIVAGICILRCDWDSDVKIL